MDDRYRVALYFGSFNPPHKGHIDAAGAALKALKPDIFMTKYKKHKRTI